MRWLILALGLGLFAYAAPAAEIQARLIRASSEEKAPNDPELADIADKLKRITGFERYQQLGRKQEKLPDKKTRIDLGKGFVLFVKPKSVKDKRYNLAIEWYGGKTLISKQTLTFSDGHFFFIKGPEVGKDWIVLALTVIE